MRRPPCTLAAQRSLHANRRHTDSSLQEATRAAGSSVVAGTCCQEATPTAATDSRFLFPPFFLLSSSSVVCHAAATGVATGVLSQLSVWLPVDRTLLPRQNFPGRVDYQKKKSEREKQKPAPQHPLRRRGCSPAPSQQHRVLLARERALVTSCASSRSPPPCSEPRPLPQPPHGGCAALSVCQRMSAYVRVRQPTSAYVSLRQRTSAYVSVRQRTSAYVSIRRLCCGRQRGQRALWHQYLYWCTSKAVQ